MKIIHHLSQFRMPFRTFGKILLLISGIMLHGFSSCRSTHPSVKYGVYPADYKQMEKPQ